MKFGADLLAVQIDWNQFAPLLYVPVLPAIACRSLLHKGSDLVDGTLEVPRYQRTVGAHSRGMPAPAVGKHLARL